MSNDTQKKSRYEKLLDNIVTGIYGIQNYQLSNFWYNSDKSKMVIEFSVEKVIHEKEFAVEDFKNWVESYYSGFTNQFSVKDFDGDFIIWDAALSNVPKFIVEDFLNSNLNISLNQ